MVDYHHILLMDLFRFLGVGVILLVVLPLLVERERPITSRVIMSNILHGSAAIIIIGHVLAILKIFDLFSILALLCLSFVGVGIRRLLRKPDRQQIFIRYMFFLVIERGTSQYLLARLRDAVSTTIAALRSWRTLEVLLLITVIGLSFFLRILPVWKNAAPFSVDTYAVLEIVNLLEANDLPIVIDFVPKGMHILMATLTLFSQTNPTLVVHYFGAVSSILLLFSVYYSAYKITGLRLAGILGSATAGIFTALLPSPPLAQVEADTMTLAIAFGIPTLHYVVATVTQPTRRTSITALAGMLAVILTDFFVGAFLLTASIVIFVSILPEGRRVVWYTPLRWLILVPLVIIVTMAMVAFVRLSLTDEPLFHALQILFFNGHISKMVDPTYRPAEAVLFGMAVLFFLLFAVSFFFSASPRRIILRTFGLTGIIVLLARLFQMGAERVVVTPAQYDPLLSVLVAIGVGVLLASLIRFFISPIILMATFPENLRRALLPLAGTFVLLAGFLLLPVRPVAFLQTVEPNGFLRGIYSINATLMPYSWTAVSHRGAAIIAMNKGRFLDYSYFTSTFDPEHYVHGDDFSVPTKYLFVFVEKDLLQSEVMTELSDPVKGSMMRMDEWLRAYTAVRGTPEIFYEDAFVVIYRFSPSPTAIPRGAA